MLADAPSGHDPQGVEPLVVLAQAAEGQGGLALPEEHPRPLGLLQQHVWEGAAGDSGAVERVGPAYTPVQAQDRSAPLLESDGRFPPIQSITRVDAAASWAEVCAGK